MPICQLSIIADFYTMRKFNTMMSWMVEVGVENNDKIQRFLKVLVKEAYQIKIYEYMFINSFLQYNLIK